MIGPSGVSGQRRRTWLGRLLDGLSNLFGGHRCPKCGGRMDVERFGPPVFVKDGTSGIRATCSRCGHVEMLLCRMGP